MADNTSETRMLCEDARDFAVETWGEHWVENEIGGLCRLAEIETGCHAQAYAEIERLRIMNDTQAEYIKRLDKAGCELAAELEHLRSQSAVRFTRGS